MGPHYLVTFLFASIKLTPLFVTMCSKSMFKVFPVGQDLFLKSINGAGPSKVWILEGDKKCADRRRFYPGSACGAVI